MAVNILNQFSGRNNGEVSLAEKKTASRPCRTQDGYVVCLSASPYRRTNLERPASSKQLPSIPAEAPIALSDADDVPLQTPPDPSSAKLHPSAVLILTVMSFQAPMPEYQRTAGHVPAASARPKQMTSIKRKIDVKVSLY